MNDAALVGLALADPPRGVAAIYERYGTSLYNYCYSILRSQADAGDALHESFVTVIDKLGQLRDPSRLRPWLYAIARNQCYKRHRQRNRERPEDPFEAGEEQSLMTDSAAEPKPGAELVAMVWEATAGLSEVDRSVLELNIRHELDGEELAAGLGVPGPKCSVMLHRAKERLRTAVGAFLVAKVGTDACGELASIVSDAEFNPLIRKRVSRHITDCVVCEQTERRNRPEAYLAAVPLLRIPTDVHKSILASIRTGTSAAPSTDAAPPRSGGPDAPGRGGSTDPAEHSAGRAGSTPTAWNDAGFPLSPSDQRSFGGDRSRRALLSGVAVACVIAVVVLLALLEPFANETTVVAGAAPIEQTIGQPTALPNPQFLPTVAVPSPTASVAAAPALGEANLADDDPTPTPTIQPIATPAVPAAPPARPTSPAPTAAPSSTPTPTVLPTPTAPPTPTSTPPPTPPPTPTSPAPVSTPSTGQQAPTSGPVFVDFVAPTVVSFTVSCGDPFRLTIEVSDSVDPSPTVDLDATWEDESDPAIPLTKLSGNTYRANVPRSELDGEHIDFFVRGTLTDSSGNTRLVDVSDNCTIIG